MQDGFSRSYYLARRWWDLVQLSRQVQWWITSQHWGGSSRFCGESGSPKELCESSQKQGSLLRKYYTTIWRCSSTELALLKQLGNGFENFSATFALLIILTYHKSPVCRSKREIKPLADIWEPFLLESSMPLKSFITQQSIVFVLNTVLWEFFFFIYEEKELLLIGITPKYNILSS